MEWVEKTGSSLEEAKEAALDALGVHPDEAEFEVVNGAEKGLFGRVKTEARVRARVAPTTPRAKDDRRRRRGRMWWHGRRLHAQAGIRRGAERRSVTQTQFRSSQSMVRAVGERTAGSPGGSSGEGDIGGRAGGFSS